MLNDISVEDMRQLLASEHPAWKDAAVGKLAEKYTRSLDARLEKVLAHFIQTGERINFRYGEFSLLQIYALRENCSFFTAILMMDAYLKDPVSGKAMILRR